MPEDFTQLSQKEIEFLREIIEKEKRWHWLARVMRNTAAWVAVIIGGLAVSWDFLSKIVKAMVK